MNKKEIREIRRRVSPERTNIEHIYGCYINSQHEIIAKIDESLGLLEKEEQEKYIAILKKSLSGTQGKNLHDLSFSTKQVREGDEHKLLAALRDTGLKDRALREKFFECVAEHLDMGDSNYLVLLAFDSYDVPHFNKDGEELEDSTDVFRYILCSVCPVKSEKSVLHFSKDENRFRNLSLAQTVAAPELGFMFPAFDRRSANIYDVLFYTRDTKGMHGDFIDALFKTPVPLSASQQHDAFGGALKESLGDSCSFALMQTMHSELRQRVLVHKESKDPEPLTVTVQEVADILENSGIDEQTRESFTGACEKRFGKFGTLSPENIIKSGKFEISTETAKIKLDPDFSSLVQTRVIDGKRYILIPADGVLEVNGIEAE